MRRKMHMRICVTGAREREGTSVGGGSEQCNEREITTRIARSDIELITCYLYYQDFRFTLSGGGATPANVRKRWLS